jgi:tripartite-type tricarboxylate transporter receptor subunit TctC
VKTLREAFTKATNDPALRAEANKKQLEVEPIRGEELDRLAKEVMAQPKELIERLKELLGK